MTSSLSLSYSPPLFPLHRPPHLSPILRISLQLHSSRSHHPLHVRATRRVSNFPPEAGNLAGDPRNWGRTLNSVYGRDEDYDEDDDEDDEEDDRSLDLLIKFVQNVFRKVSKRARKAVLSVLPISISTKLVGFSVNGVLVLALLWVSKAFLEVICTLGSIVFISILVIRGIWAGISYIQDSRNHYMNEIDDDHRAWSGTQPAA